MLLEGGIKPDEIEISDIWINFSAYSFIDNSDPSEMFMHHVIIKQKNIDAVWDQHYLGKPIRKKRRLLFIAGYGSAGASYFALFNELQNHFEIHIPDILGFGSSGRPEFICRNIEETKEYFIASVREWVLKTGFDKEGPYSIFGHSLGCWIASVYAERYPENIEQILFISPASMAKPPADFCPHRWLNA